VIAVYEICARFCSRGEPLQPGNLHACGSSPRLSLLNSRYDKKKIRCDKQRGSARRNAATRGRMIVGLFVSDNATESFYCLSGYKENSPPAQLYRAIPSLSFGPRETIRGGAFLDFKNFHRPTSVLKRVNP